MKPRGPFPLRRAEVCGLSIGASTIPAEALGGLMRRTPPTPLIAVAVGIGSQLP
jgi:hypothetical protein